MNLPFRFGFFLSFMSFGFKLAMQLFVGMQLNTQMKQNSESCGRLQFIMMVLVDLVLSRFHLNLFITIDWWLLQVNPLIQRDVVNSSGTCSSTRSIAIYFLSAKFLPQQFSFPILYFHVTFRELSALLPIQHS